MNVDQESAVLIDLERGLDKAAATLYDAQGCPLDIRVALYIAVPDAAQQIAAFFDLVKPHAQRWRSIAFDMPVARWMDLALSVFAAMRLNLESVSLAVNANTDVAYWSTAYTPLRAVPFHAHHLRLDAVPAWELAWFTERLTRLELRNHRRPGYAQRTSNTTLLPPFAAFLDMLRCTPHLATLIIDMSGPLPPDATTAAAYAPVALPVLDDVTFKQVDARTVGALLQHFSAPALRALDVEWGAQREGIDDLLQCLPQVVPGLASLRVATPGPFAPGTWPALLDGLPALATLALEATDADAARLATLMRAAPALDTLQFTHESHVNGGALLALARARLDNPAVAALRRVDVAWCEQVRGEEVRALCEVVPEVSHSYEGQDDEDELDQSIEEMDLSDEESEDDEEGDDDIQDELAWLRANAAHDIVAQNLRA